MKRCDNPPAPSKPPKSRTRQGVGSYPNSDRFDAGREDQDTPHTNFAERAWLELHQVASTNFPDWHPAHFLDTAELTHACFRGPDGTTSFHTADAVTLRTRWQDADVTFLGFKAGEVGASHGHLDAGSFVLDAPGGDNCFAVADLTSAYGLTRVWRGVQLLNHRRWIVDVDLRVLAQDLDTAVGNLCFAVSNPVNGSATVLADGRTSLSVRWPTLADQGIPALYSTAEWFAASTR